MRKFVVKSALFFVIFSVCLQLGAQNQEPAFLAMADTGAYSVIERSDWRRYNDGKYVGLVRNEVRASIIPMEDEGSLLYQGNFFVLQRTLRDMRQSAQAVDAVVPVSFELQGNGTLIIDNDNGYPMMRSFPAFPAQSVTKGYKWQASGSRAVDPFNVGSTVVIPFIAEYEYRGTELYKDIPVHRIYATYANRYQNPNPQANGFSRVMGSHKVDILIRVEDGLPLFMRDDLDETFTMADGSTVQFRGFTLTFNEGSLPMDRGELIASLGDFFKNEKPRDPDIPFSASLPDNSSIDITPVPEGIKLTVKDIRFAPDSADFLPAERPRLDLIAEALKQHPGRSFLVEGHTASIGNPSGEMQLSIERAEHMVAELVNRGISADRFIYKGWGGIKPVGDNSTDAGRSANRRVEITILE